MLLLDLLDLRFRGLDLGLGRCLVAIGIRQLGLQRRALIFQRTGLHGGAAQGLAQAIGFRLGERAAGQQRRRRDHHKMDVDAHDQNLALRSTCRTSTA